MAFTALPDPSCAEKTRTVSTPELTGRFLLLGIREADQRTEAPSSLILGYSVSPLGVFLFLFHLFPVGPYPMCENFFLNPVFILDFTHRHSS